MKQKFILALSLILLLSFTSYPVFAYQDEDINSIGVLDENINEIEKDNLPEYVPLENNLQVEPRIGGIVRYVIRNGMKVYKSIKYAPKYPAGFKVAKNGTTHHT
ncbi:hypothetical protein, partial [Mammaliicoccus sciuri]|uniref:hypothetical protein n=1 Tax=Mammaliicoccus sciuri TaxID=1296 RepID=UPI00226F7EAC